MECVVAGNGEGGKGETLSLTPRLYTCPRGHYYKEGMGGCVLVVDQVSQRRNIYNEMNEDRREGILCLCVCESSICTLIFCLNNHSEYI